MTLPLPTSHAKLLLPAAALVAALGAAWWLAPASVERHGTVADSSARDTAAPSGLDNVSSVQSRQGGLGLCPMRPCLRGLGVVPGARAVPNAPRVFFNLQIGKT